MLLLLQSLLAPATPPPSEPERLAQGGVGTIPLRKPGHTAPWHWVPFRPVAAKRPRKKRQGDLLFLGQ